MKTVLPDGKLQIIKWQNALTFSGKLGPKPLTRATLLTMATRANNDDLTFYMGVDELGKRLGVNKRTAERYLKDALNSGWIVQTARGSGRSGRVSDYMLVIGDTDNPDGVILPPSVPESMPDTSDGYSQGVPDSSTACPESIPDTFDGYSDGGGENTRQILCEYPTDFVEIPDRSVGPTTPQLLPTTKNTRSVEPTARNPKPLPTDWEPNATHRRLISDAGTDAEWMVAEFRYRMEGERRTDWDSTFGAFVNAVSDGREDEVFPLPDDGGVGSVGPGGSVPVVESPPVGEVVAEVPITWEPPAYYGKSFDRVALMREPGITDEDRCEGLAQHEAHCREHGLTREGTTLAEFIIMAHRGRRSAA